MEKGENASAVWYTEPQREDFCIPSNASGQKHVPTNGDHPGSDIHEEERSMTDQETLQDIIKALPAELQKEVEDFARFLLEKHGKTPQRKPRFDWAGALKDLRGHYTSVDLQHKIAAWRIGGE